MYNNYVDSYNYGSLTGSTMFLNQRGFGDVEVNNSSIFQYDKIILNHNTTILSNLQVSGLFSCSSILDITGSDACYVLQSDNLAGLITGNTNTINSLITINNSQDTSLGQKLDKIDTNAQSIAGSGRRGSGRRGAAGAVGGRPRNAGYAKRCRHHFPRGGYCQQEVTGGCARGLAPSLARRSKLNAARRTVGPASACSTWTCCATGGGHQLCRAVTSTAHVTVRAKTAAALNGACVWLKISRSSARKGEGRLGGIGEGLISRALPSLRRPPWRGGKAQYLRICPKGSQARLASCVCTVAFVRTGADMSNLDASRLAGNCDFVIGAALQGLFIAWSRVCIRVGGSYQICLGPMPWPIHPGPHACMALFEPAPRARRSHDAAWNHGLQPRACYCKAPRRATYQATVPWAHWVNSEVWHSCWGARGF